MPTARVHVDVAKRGLLGVMSTHCFDGAWTIILPDLPSVPIQMEYGGEACSSKWR